MSLSINYNLRHILAKKTTNSLTILGVALVVFVFISSLMLASGLEKTLAATGSKNNLIVLRTGAQNEIQSGVTRDHAAIVLSQPEVTLTPEGKPFGTSDVVALINIKKRSNGKPSNVTIRGVNLTNIGVRDGVKIRDGRLPAPGTNEVMVGNAIHEKFVNTNIGQQLRIVGINWQVVGVFDAGQTGFSSEIWGDSDILMSAFKRERFSSITFRLQNPAQYTAVKERIENDRRLTVVVKREQDFYAEQSSALATFIRYLGTFVTIIFSLGAIVGAMITMYSAVAGREREIGTLRALGFGRATILLGFLKESALISSIGGLLGIVAASLMQLVTFSTTNFRTFSDLTFGFSINLRIVVYGLAFALVMGVLGGLLPAWKAARVKVVDALRS
jgi:putative ABC transport system permease protein